MEEEDLEEEEDAAVLLMAMNPNMILIYIKRSGVVIAFSASAIPVEITYLWWVRVRKVRRAK